MNVPAAAPATVSGTVTVPCGTLSAPPLQTPHTTVTDARFVSADPSVLVDGFVQVTWALAAWAAVHSASASARAIRKRM